MEGLVFNIANSGVFLGLALYLAWKKRSWKIAHLSSLFVSVSWLPGIALKSLISEGINQGWEWLVISMAWLAGLLVLGLCLMYGSKRIHSLGRLMIILALIAISILLVALVLLD